MKLKLWDIFKVMKLQKPYKLRTWVRKGSVIRPVKLYRS